VFKFASCDGCQLQLLEAGDRLLELAGRHGLGTEW
jgi:coenzyme F420-reducing hydrogenase gamma subunit